MTDFDDLARLLRRAETRERTAQAEEVGNLFGEMFKADEERRLVTALGSQNDEVALDRMRSERESMRANTLETRRLLGGEPLTDDEERERVDLASRRDEITGYYRPTPDGGSE